MPRKNVKFEGQIDFQNLLKIKTIDGNFIQTDQEIEEDVCYNIQAETQSYSTRKALWQLIKIDQDDSDTTDQANRMASLYPTLQEFYIFL